MIGATVTRDISAYGPESLDFEYMPRLSDDPPILIEIVDTEQKIRQFRAVVEAMLESGLGITQKVGVLRYGR